MQQISTIAELRQVLSEIRRKGQKIGLVPTMGNLHQGHLSLVDIVKQHADVIVVTIFVNPTQFIEGEDFESYPRTLDNDLSMLDEKKVDIVFTPSVEEMYLEGAETEVTVLSLDNIHCGHFRPGHFKGVATVVNKLFNIVQADVAVFGKKDYQQLLVIKRLVRDLCIQTNILSGEIIREENGLAMSSRNRYLSDSERIQAAKLYESLQHIACEIRKGNTDFTGLQKSSIGVLKKNGLRPDYVEICDADSLGSPTSNNLVIIAAAWLGKARLIDNVAVHTYD